MGWLSLRAAALYSPEEQKISDASRTIGRAVVTVAVLGVVALWIWAYGVGGAAADTPPGFWALMGANLLLGWAAAAAGAVLGFIFGIPRTMNAADRAAVANAVSQDGITGKTQAVMAANTNLERVSDWLTTLLIGATLVQVKDIVRWIGGLGKDLVKPGPLANDALVPVIIVFFFFLSFLGVYLITRLYLTSAFNQTLVMLTGAGPAPDDASIRKEWSERLAGVIKANKTEDMVSALKALDEAKLPDDIRKSPEISANVARLLAKLIVSGADSGRASPKDDLRASINIASSSPSVAEELKQDAAAGRLATGDTNLDNEVRAKLGLSAGEAMTPPKSEVAVMSERFDAALSSEQADDISAALEALADTTLRPETKEEASLNAKVVRLAAKLLDLNAAPDRQKTVEMLKAAAERVAKAPDLARTIREGIDEGSVSTGDPELDTEIKSKLSST
jgi:hypothetical protein